MPANKQAIHICVVPCARTLHHAVLAFCARRDVDPSTLARVSLALLDERPDLALTDPGPGEFERVVVISPSGQPRTRQVLTRLRLRVAGVCSPDRVRIALATFLATAAQPAPDIVAPEISAPGAAAQEIARLRDENARLRAALDRVAPRPATRVPRTPAQAAWLMGFPNEWGLDAATVTTRYRQLAMIYHPDTGIAADEERLAQISAARSILLQRIKA
jgi:hypothetical protein